MDDNRLTKQIFKYLWGKKSTSSWIEEVQKDLEKIISICIKEEIKRLYILKSNLNTKLYLAHLEILNELHPAVINGIFDIINRQINKLVSSLKCKQIRKFQNLYTKQHIDNNTLEHSHVFYQRVANYTGIKFEQNEMALLNKGLI